MARSIVLSLAGAPSSFAFTKLERDKLYGWKERQVIDEAGQRCVGAWLTADGAALIPSGGLALQYVDEGFTTVERSSLRAVDDEGAELAVQPSTLGVEQPLEGPVPPARLLDHAIHTVYQLAPETLAPELAAALQAGGIFTAPFSYRDDVQRQALFLVRNEAGLFALVGQPHGFQMVRQDAPPPAAAAAEDGDDLADDLDFTML